MSRTVLESAARILYRHRNGHGAAMRQQTRSELRRTLRVVRSLPRD